jgi:hypothetical protein
LSRPQKENLKELNKPENPEDDKPKDPALAAEFALLPKVNAFVAVIYKQAGLSPIDLAADAILYNFPLATDIVVYFHI